MRSFWCKIIGFQIALIKSSGDKYDRNNGFKIQDQRYKQSF